MKVSFLLPLSGLLFCACTSSIPENNNGYDHGYIASSVNDEVLESAYQYWKRQNLVEEQNGMFRISGDYFEITVSEGIGYGMLLAAYHNDRESFDGLFKYYKFYCTDEAYGLMAWRIENGSISDPGSATDGDLDVVFSLLVAYQQWKEDYLLEAKQILNILKEHYFIKCDGIWVMKPGGQFGGCNLTDLSYYTPGYFRVFAEVTEDPFWEEAADDTYILLSNAADGTTGLVPDWQSPSGIPGGLPPKNPMGYEYYYYDAARVPFRMAIDYLWYGNKKSKRWCTTVSDFAGGIGAANIVNGYELDGTPKGRYNSSVFVGGFGVSAMCNNQNLVDEFANRLIAIHNSGRDDSYFSLALRNIYFLVLSGKFQKPVILN